MRCAPGDGRLWQEGPRGGKAQEREVGELRPVGCGRIPRQSGEFGDARALVLVLVLLMALATLAMLKRRSTLRAG